MKNINSDEKNVLVTGGTSGLGLELVKVFLNKGYNVVALGRQTLHFPGFENKFNLFVVDFCDMSQVAAITKNVCQTYDFNIVINNAGILSPPAFTPTINGFEYTFQVNYLSHLLINEIILRKIKDNRQVKIAAVTSPVYKLANTDLTISEVQSYSPFRAYTSSKLYLTLMCEFLPLRYPEVNLQCFSFDPGTFSSSIYRMQKKWFRNMYHIASPFMRRPGKVAQILAEILLKEEIGNGVIYDIRKRLRTVPLISEHEREAFQRGCYDLVNPLLV